MRLKRVLFVAYGAGHIRTVLPIVKALKADRAAAAQFEPVILGLTTARREVEAAGFKCLGFRDLIVPDEDSAALAWGRELVGDPEPDSPVPHSESVAYMGLNFRDLVAQNGEERAREKVETSGRASFLPMLTARRALERLHIDAVVATGSPRAERAFLTAAREKGCPSLAVWLSLSSYTLAWIGRKGFTSKVCVDSVYARRRLIGAGRPSDEIVITGNPQFDALIHGARQTECADFREQKGWLDNDRVLLFASQVEPERHPFTGETGDPGLSQKLANALSAAVIVADDRVRLCVRCHPNEPPIDLPEKTRISQSGQSDDLASLLHAVDAVFTCSSTLGYQAALIGKPVVQGMFSMFSKDVPFHELAGAREVSDLADLGKVFSDLCADKLRRPNMIQSVFSEPAAVKVLDVLKGFWQ